MTATADILPAEFAALVPFVDAWAGLSEGARAIKRANSSLPELQRFYDVAAPLLEPMLNRLQQIPIGALSPADRRLYELALALVEVSFSVEVYREARPEGVYDVEHVTFKIDEEAPSNGA